MKNKVIVFDFDKTLTYKDTLLGFYFYISEKNIFFYIKLSIYFIFMVLLKLNIISNHFFKSIGFKFFLKNKKINHIEEKSKKFASKINFNKLFHSYNFNCLSNTIYIVSASYQVYLKYIFPENVKIYASQFTIEKGLASKFNFNCYGINKKLVLTKNKVLKIDKFYTDSYSDKSLARISDSINIVIGDKTFTCNNYQDFKNFFKR